MTGLNDEMAPTGSARRDGPGGLLIMAFVGICMLIGIIFLAWLGSPRIEPAVGQKIRRLDLSPLAFADAPFAEQDLAGKVTVLHFWGTWCVPCISEFPEFVKVYEEFRGNTDVQFVSVSSSQGPEYDMEALAESTKRFLESFDATVPTYSDPAGLSRVEAAMLLPDGSLPYPCTFVLDRQGIVVGVWWGYSGGKSSMPEVAEKVHRLLEQRPTQLGG